MKKSLWTALALTVVLTFVSQSALRLPSQPAKIKVENDATVLPGIVGPASANFAYDPYFMPVNNFRIFR